MPSNPNPGSIVGSSYKGLNYQVVQPGLKGLGHMVGNYKVEALKKRREGRSPPQWVLIPESYWLAPKQYYNLIVLTIRHKN